MPIAVTGLRKRSDVPWQVMVLPPSRSVTGTSMSVAPVTVALVIAREPDPVNVTLPVPATVSVPTVTAAEPRSMESGLAPDVMETLSPLAGKVFQLPGLDHLPSLAPPVQVDVPANAAAMPSSDPRNTSILLVSVMKHSSND